MVESYPLYWPEVWVRAKSNQRKRNYHFKESFAANRDELMEELRRLGAAEVVLSTNIPLRRDGLPLGSARAPEDPGIAVYFKYKKKQMCFACDKYQLVSENIRAIALTIAAIRGIERWGASDMIERAFRGFTAIEYESSDWRTVLGFDSNSAPTIQAVETAFKEKAFQHHPDKGGDATKFHQLVEARKRARVEIEG